MESARRTLEAISRATARERKLIYAAQGRSVETGDQLEALVSASRALRKGGIACALIGGVAVGIRSGVPRATNDIYLAVPTSNDREQIPAALREAGFEETGRFEHSVNFVHRNGEPLQVAFDEEFDAAIDAAEELDIGGATIRVVRTADLIAMKERAARDPARRPSKALRDQADVALLKGDVEGPDEGW